MIYTRYLLCLDIFLNILNGFFLLPKSGIIHNHFQSTFFMISNETVQQRRRLYFIINRLQTFVYSLQWKGCPSLEYTGPQSTSSALFCVFLLDKFAPGYCLDQNPTQMKMNQHQRDHFFVPKALKAERQKKYTLFYFIFKQQFYFWINKSAILQTVLCAITNPSL